jgi:hypothetical protein
MDRQPIIVTLGPAGSCHENALRNYLRFQGVADVRVELTEDLLSGLEAVRAGDADFLLQCSAHPLVHVVTERYWREVFVVDTFIYPTKELALLARRGADAWDTLGLVPATAGYVDRGRWRRVVDEPSKPIVGRNLLDGRYGAGLTHLHYAEDHPELLEVIEVYGAVDTTWLLYGRSKRFRGSVIGVRAPEVLRTGSS